MQIVIFIPKACDMYAVRTYFIIKLTFEQKLDYFSGKSRNFENGCNNTNDIFITFHCQN
jgi:hypothetical protein